MRGGLGKAIIIFGGSAFLLLFVTMNHYDQGKQESLEGRPHRQSMKNNMDSYDSKPITEEKADLLPPCGQICSYTGRVVRHHKTYPQLQKDVDCTNIMKRMASKEYDIVYPPPRTPPKDLYDEYTQFGELPLEKYQYFTDFKPGQEAAHRIYSVDFVSKLIDKAMSGKNINTYPDGGCANDIVGKFEEEYSGMDGVVIGTVVPWLESMLVANGANHVTTLEYTSTDIRHPQMEAYSPYTYAEKFLNGTAKMFDFGASFSSIEHSGLGRYGDPLNPYGDMEAMAQAWCMVKPGGLFILGVPGNLNKGARLIWNGNRHYNATRLKHVTANWEVIDSGDCPKDIHTVVVMRKP